MSYKNVDDKREYHRQYMRDQRQWWKSRKCCCDCGKRDYFTERGDYRCADCAVKHNAKKRDREKEAERAKVRTAERRENHLCTQCGKLLPKIAYPYVMCEKCRAKSRVRLERQRRGKGIMPRNLYAELGLCSKCGEPRMNGLTAWGGDPIKLCERCYNNAIQAAKSGRESFKKQHGTTWGNYQYEYEKLIRHGQERACP